MGRFQVGDGVVLKNGGIPYPMTVVALVTPEGLVKCRWTDKNEAEHCVDYPEDALADLDENEIMGDR